MERLEVSGALRPIYWSLDVKGLTVARPAGLQAYCGMSEHQN